MVSTRGIKLKFIEGERVLCYEPDPTKAKVLYDSKVLDIVINKDPKGRKAVEYLIHFQGWNSSWDRCVGEEFVLKDTAENRQLQKDLAEKSQLQLGAYLYRKERKKHNRKNTERVGHSSEDGSSGSPARMDTDDGHNTSSSDDDSSIEEDYVHIELTLELRQLLENDYFLINSSHKLHTLPAEPTVATILELYCKHFSSRQMCLLNDKGNSRYKNPLGQQKLTPEDVQANLITCKEVMDGLRVYFDYTLNDFLLYKLEKNQVQMSQAISVVAMKNDMKQDSDYGDYNHSHQPNNNTTDEDYNYSNDHDDVRITRRRVLRSNANIETHTNGNSNHSHSSEHVNNSKSCPSVASSNSDISIPIIKPVSWKLLPDHVYLQMPPPPCLLYGATHLTRLLVKLPELLNVSCITEHGLKKLLTNLDPFIDFLNEHKEWYGEKHYINVERKNTV